MSRGLPALLVALVALVAACGGEPAAPAPGLAEVPSDGLLPRLLPPADLAYPGSPAVLALGRPAPALAPSLAGGPAETFHVSPPLPAGLALDPATGAVAGVPAALAPMTVHVVTATNAAGAASAGLRLAVLAPGEVWLDPQAAEVVTRGELTFAAAVAGGGALAFEASAGAVDPAGRYTAGWLPGLATVRAYRPDAPGASATATVEVLARRTSNVEVALVEPAGAAVEGAALRIGARITSRYLLVSAEATFDGVPFPLELGLDGLWGATIDVSALPAGPRWLRVAGIDFQGSESELFRELTLVR